MNHCQSPAPTAYSPRNPFYIKISFYFLVCWLMTLHHQSQTDYLAVVYTVCTDYCMHCFHPPVSVWLVHAEMAAVLLIVAAEAPPVPFLNPAEAEECGRFSPPLLWISPPAPSPLLSVSLPWSWTSARGLLNTGNKHIYITDESILFISCFFFFLIVDSQSG